MTFSDLDEVLTFLGGDGDPEELLDAPLRADPLRVSEPTRFSDGTWRVFYGAADWDTAAAEIGYHVMTAAEGLAAMFYYQRLECNVDGDGCDLRAHAAAIWPFLTDRNEAAAYPGCQMLAREARDNDADGLLTLPARRDAGVNVPVFRRGALRDPRIVGGAAVELHPGGLEVKWR
jgi:hypothetical protein